MIADPLSNFTTTVGAYLLATDHVNSAVWYAANVLSSAPVWVKGADVEGTYTVIRATKTAGAVLIYAAEETLPPSDCAPYLYDFRSSLYDWVVETGSWVTTEGVYSVNDGGWQWVRVRLTCSAPLSSTSHIRVSLYMSYWETHGDRIQLIWYDSGGNQVRNQYSTALGPGETSFNYYTNGVANAVTLRFVMYAQSGSVTSIVRSVEIT